jgi:AraC-like DNA-binding protein
MISEEYTHNPVTLLHIADELRQRGVPPVEIFRRANISPLLLLDRNRWIPRSLCLTLGHEAEKATGEPFFASRIGQNFQLAEFGVWGQTIMGAETLGEACAAAATGVGLLHRGSSLQMLDFGDHVRLRFAYLGSLRADPSQHLIGTLAVLRKIALLGGAPDAIRVRLSAPYVRGADCLEETHGSRLEFGCDHDEIVIDRDVLDMPLPGDGDAADRDPIEALQTAEEVGTLLRQLLPYRRANIDVVAAKRHTSRRTLQRRLADWGFTFEELLDETRRTEALRLVRSGEHPAIEVAFLLGYSDAAHFTRAFRRWTGMPPRDYLRTLKTSQV